MLKIIRLFEKMTFVLYELWPMGKKSYNVTILNFDIANGVLIDSRILSKMRVRLTVKDWRCIVRGRSSKFAVNGMDVTVTGQRTCIPCKRLTLELSLF